MRKFILILFIFSWISTLVSAQSLKVESVREIGVLNNTPYLIKKAGPDGQTLFLTKQGFVGIYSFNINSGEINTLTEDPGAGYQFAVSADGNTIFYRSAEYDGPKKFYSLKKVNLASGEKEILIDRKREMHPPQLINNSMVGFLADNKLQVTSSSETERINSVNEVTGYYAVIENRKINLFSNDSQKILSPLGEGIYIWPSVSTNRDRLLFTLAGKGTYISDTEGNIIHDLGYANAPVWSKNGQWIAYMVDRDDGHQITESEIWIVSADNSNKIQVTQTPSIHEMYPVWGPETSHLYFSTVNGRHFVAELTE